ncbi:PEP-CTERM sorting domain-containing protein [Rhodoferax sp.]|uniref:PEP-CTERM sorting domain-containing protein n=1 Tax=Rhodoferax sp. TaxID=50421 RepID=UPI0025E97CEA|nr:PEP-CTERM sorting domain-containing protein [Rhodoferax sp.]
MLSKLSTLLRQASLCLLIATAIPTAQAALVYNNLGAAPSGSDPIYGYGPLANSFTTGAEGGTLRGVQALLMNLGPDVVGNVQVNLLASNGAAPGSTLLSLGSLSSADIASSGFQAYSFAPTSAFDLAANTTYWLQILAADVNAIQWAFASDLSFTGVAGESSYSAAFGVSPNASAALDGFGPYQMAVEVPEPGSLALVTLGLIAVVFVRRRSASQR